MINAMAQKTANGLCSSHINLHIFNSNGMGYNRVCRLGILCNTGRKKKYAVLILIILTVLRNLVMHCILIMPYIHIRFIVHNVGDESDALEID